MDFSYKWCWECNKITVVFDDSDLCCNQTKYVLPPELVEWMAANPAPTAPTEKEILDHLHKYKNFNDSPEDILIANIFNAFSYVSYGRLYWLASDWAKKLDISIPSYEELCADLGVEPIYDCKTPLQWAKDEEKVLNLLGWRDEEFLLNAPIPYWEFCRRQRIGKIREGKNI